jgi:hypothetical protein
MQDAQQPPTVVMRKRHWAMMLMELAGYTTIRTKLEADDIRAAHGNITWATVSDVRVKKDIEDSTVGLNFINDLRPVTFNYKNKGDLPKEFRGYEEGSTEVYKSEKTQHGFIAQEVKSAIDKNSDIKNGFSMWDDDDDTGQQRVGETALDTSASQSNPRTVSTKC